MSNQDHLKTATERTDQSHTWACEHAIEMARQGKSPIGVLKDLEIECGDTAPSWGVVVYILADVHRNLCAGTDKPTKRARGPVRLNPPKDHPLSRKLQQAPVSRPNTQATAPPSTVIDFDKLRRMRMAGR